MVKDNFELNPYEVSGKIDYDKIVSEFGLKILNNDILQRLKEKTGELHPFLRRKIFFAHRDLDKLLDRIEKGERFFLYTGCGPSGPIHLGHIATWRFTKWLQEKFDVELWFQFTDDEKFLFKDKSFEEIKNWTYQNMLDVAALGFDPKKTHFIIDSVHAGILYPEALKVAKKITFSTIKASFGFTNSNNIGSIFYTAMQTVPVFLPNVLNGKKELCLIPLGIDQDPHFRISRDIVEKLGFEKPIVIHSKMMSPINGPEGKMSSSDPNKAILLTDDEKTVRKKINKYAFSGGRDTLEDHRKFGGNPDIDVSYLWLQYFEEDDSVLENIYNDYKSGKLLSGELKSILINKINDFLKKHQEKRRLIEKNDLLKEFIFEKKC